MRPHAGTEHSAVDKRPLASYYWSMSNNEAIESLRQFAFDAWMAMSPCDYQDACNHMSAFIHMCIAARNGEGWAKERVTEVLEMVHEITSEPPGVYDTRNTLEIIRETDCTRPDGSIARGQVIP